MTKAELEDLTGQMLKYADGLENGNIPRQDCLAKLLRKVSSRMVSLHQSYVNECYRSQGMQPWMRSPDPGPKGV